MNKKTTMGKTGYYSTFHRVKRAAGTFLYKFFRGLLLFGLCFLIIMPLFQKLSASLMSFNDSRDITVVYIPRYLNFSNYSMAFELMEFMPTLGFTLVMISLCALLQVCVCMFAAYGFARYKFPLKRLLFLCVMLVIIVPVQTIFGPLYLNFMFFDVFGIFRGITGSTINMLNNSGSYILFYAGGMGIKSGLYIFMLRQYFRTLPKDLEEAAYIDGCGRFRTFLRIILPDAAPMVTSCFLFSFVWQWTDSLYTTMFLTRYPIISSKLASLSSNFVAMWKQRFPYDPMPSPHSIVAAGTLMTLVPLVLIYLFAQRKFVQSISQTGLKM
jgi:multiple sugar transport system permease protein